MSELSKTPPQALPRLGNSLIWLWGSWLLLIVVKAFHFQASPLEAATGTSLTLIVVHAVIVSLTFLITAPPKFALLLTGAYFARLFTVFIDRFAPLDVPFLGGGGDADGFFLAASQIANDVSLAGDTYGGAYTAILGYLFYFIGPDRLLAQYLNVLLGLTTVILTYGILRQLRISVRVSGIVLSLAAFMPMLVIHSAVLLRETFVQVFVAAALSCFVRGLLKSKLGWTLVSMLWVLAASIFHAGVIGLLLAFVVASAFTYRQDGRFVFGVKRVASVVLIAFTVAIVLLQYPDLFLGKFQTLESPDDLLEAGLSGRGGSAYLTGLEVNNWTTFIIYAPLRAIYFVASPLPWDWRGTSDMISFGLDSIIYLSIVILFFAHKINDPNRRYLAVILALVLILTTLIFGVGVSNSGTAIRHRGKLITIFLVLLAIIIDSLRQNQTSGRRKRRTVRNNAR